MLNFSEDYKQYVNRKNIALYLQDLELPSGFFRTQMVNARILDQASDLASFGLPVLSFNDGRCCGIVV